MIKLIRRTTDKKFLQSVETDTWVDNVKEAFEMSYMECESAKTELYKTYPQEQIKELYNFQKMKPMSDEEKQQLLNLFKNK